VSKLRIEVLTPPSPYQTYLEERLQSARGLGWTYAPPTAPAATPASEPSTVAIPAITPEVSPA
jgi:hypothetical protein